MEGDIDRCEICGEWVDTEETITCFMCGRLIGPECVSATDDEICSHCTL